MSIALMNAAWKAVLPTTRKFVLLSLSDQSNDYGDCYPSISMIARRCSINERTVYSCIDDLEKYGFLQKEFRAGRSTVYHITDPCTWPVIDKENKKDDPCTTFTPEFSSPLNVVHPTPERRSPITTIEPPIEPSYNQKNVRVREKLEIPDWLNQDSWRMWCDYRKGGKGKWTKDAQRLSIRKLNEFRHRGHDPTDVIELAIERGWQGLYEPRGNDEQRNYGTSSSKPSAVERVQNAIAEREKREGGHSFAEAITIDSGQVLGENGGHVWPYLD